MSAREKCARAAIYQARVMQTISSARENGFFFRQKWACMDCGQARHAPVWGIDYECNAVWVGISL
jgi:hypothetical protein